MFQTYFGKKFKFLIITISTGLLLIIIPTVFSQVKIDVNKKNTGFNEVFPNIPIELGNFLGAENTVWIITVIAAVFLVELLIWIVIGIKHLIGIIKTRKIPND